MILFAQLLPPGTQEAIGALKPLADHASQQGFQWHFELLFFLLIAVVIFMAWSGSKIVRSFLESKTQAEARQHEQYLELAKRLREVEDAHKSISQQFAREFAELQTRSVRAMEDVAETLREIKETIHHK